MRYFSIYNKFINWNLKNAFKNPKNKSCEAKANNPIRHTLKSFLVLVVYIIIPKESAIVKTILAITISKEYRNEADMHMTDSDKVIESNKI